MNSRKPFKFLVALLLLPACVALTVTSFRVARELAFGLRDQSRMIGLAFWGGYGLWLAIFTFLPKTIRTYVLGHELTHALWALMMGARVSGLRVGKAGGQVRTSKNNWLITLAPYFFPFYAVLFIVAFFIVDLVWGLDRQVWVLFFLVGLGWSFHVSFTIYTLLTAQQPDVKSQGWLFSMTVIFCMNLATILLAVAVLSRAVSLGTVITAIGRDLALAYGWTLDKLSWLWQSLAS
jgi:hypothetical protein